ncbi:acetylglutamate kinase [Terrihabitans soli]|uniref:Acetylglutamate kinase n=1 Tax=Terrihabitans soli TaxID=708113 RepID=A0A6S6QML7_9HYPH|nr:acetylglutamate kinase [Terrihabitans soli]BCJ91704.1 acetylglutamate kinase [Terrihabitans soli]
MADKEISAHDRARVLAEALPQLQRYDDATIVVKYGGHAMGDEHLLRQFARDIVMLKISGLHPIVVHGGGPQIGSMLERLNIKSEFQQGLRVTDRPTMDVVEMVLAGSINKGIVAAINAEGGRAVGLSGKDGGMVQARKVTTLINGQTGEEDVIDLGFVGEPESVDRRVLDIVSNSDLIPVIAPIAASRWGETYNINADTFAGAIAGAMRARRLLLLTDVPGVLDKDKNLIKQMTIDDSRKRIADGTVSGGMIPKVQTCIEALERGVEGVVILDGKVPHAVLLELLTDHGAGSLITR